MKVKILYVTNNRKWLGCSKKDETTIWSKAAVECQKLITNSIINKFPELPGLVLNIVKTIETIKVRKVWKMSRSDILFIICLILGKKESLVHWYCYSRWSRIEEKLGKKMKYWIEVDHLWKICCYANWH